MESIGSNSPIPNHSRGDSNGQIQPNNNSLAIVAEDLLGIESVDLDALDSF